MGGFEEYAYRAQLLLSPSDDLSFLFNIHGREMSNGTAAIFRANVLGPGSDGFNSNYDRDSVTFDEGGNNPQEASGLGASLKIDWTFGNHITLTSVSAWESTDDKSEGDIDGGFGADFLGTRSRRAVPAGPPAGPDAAFHSPRIVAGRHRRSRSVHPGNSLRPAGDRRGVLAGRRLLFRLQVPVTTFPFFVPPTTVEHKNTAWAAFAHVSVDVTDAWNITGGVRYTDDDKDFRVIATPCSFHPLQPVSVSDSKFSWDLSALYKVNDGFSVYGRVADGFRAPTIQGRDVAFGGAAIDCGLRDDHLRGDRVQVGARRQSRALERRGVLLRDQGPAVVGHWRRRQLRAAW